MWLDEVISLVTYFRLPPQETVLAYQSPNQHLLYSVLASLSISCFGESAWAARLPSTVLGTASIPAIYWLTRQISSPRAALLSAALLAFSYHHIWFSQSARGYTGMVLSAIVGTSLLFEARKSGAAIWLTYAVVMAIGIGFLQNTLFVLIGHLLAVLLVERRVGLAHGVATLGSLGLALVAHAGILEKIVEFWLKEERTGWGSGIGSFAGLFGLFARGLEAGFFVSGAVFVVAFAAFGWCHLWKTNQLMATLFVTPSLVGFGAVLVLKYGAYPRAFLHVLPFVFATIAHFAVTGTGRLKAVLPTTLVLCSVLTLGGLYRYPKQNYSGALAAIQKEIRPSDRVAGAGMAGGVYRMYYASDLAVIRTIGELKQLEAESERVWILFSFTRDMRLRFSELYEYLELNYETVNAYPGTLDDGTIFTVRRKLK